MANSLEMLVELLRGDPFVHVDRLHNHLKPEESAVVQRLKKEAPMTRSYLLVGAGITGVGLVLGAVDHMLGQSAYVAGILTGIGASVFMHGLTGVDTLYTDLVSIEREADIRYRNSAVPFSVVPSTRVYDLKGNPVPAYNANSRSELSPP